MTANCHILVGTPAYGGMVHVSYLNTITDLHRSGLPFSVMTISNESLITRARNTLLSTFQARSEFTHLLFLDADVHMAAADVQRLIGHGKDVIGAPVALKGRRADGTRIFNIGRTLGEEAALHQVEHIGTAAFMLARPAVNALIGLAVREARIYEPNVFSAQADIAPLHHDVFRVGVVDGRYLSEDYWVCRELRQLGFEIWVDPAIVTQHHGTIAA